MADTRKIIRAFLASPGDLQEERKAVRDVVSEFNESWADELGYQVELMGWEETIAGYGRPQHLINQDLDRCDLFIGMIWKRWGTQPDAEGQYTSGFHEEFERSAIRREGSGRPEMSLFFKTIPEEFMDDPGPDLQRVLDFKERVISERRFLFQTFSTVREMETHARKCITAYVNIIKGEDRNSEAPEDEAKRAKSGNRKESSETKSSDTSPLSAEGSEFLRQLVERLREDQELDTLTACHIARFRLLANSISKPGNHEMEVGVHDINILFAARAQDMRLGTREIRALIVLAFRHLNHENVPLWCWYSSLVNSAYDPALISAFAGANDNERIGAINVLRMLDRELPDDEAHLPREWVINSWFSEGASAAVRNAALNYLGAKGRADDLGVAKAEYDLSDYATSRSALECMIRVLLRNGPEDAVPELLLNHQFDSLDAATLRAALELFEGVGVQQLKLGLEHRNADVRLKSITLLDAKGYLDGELADRLTRDSDARIRNHALTTLLKRGRSFSEKEIQSILAPPRKEARAAGILLAFSGESDMKGEELLSLYKMQTLMRLAETELEEKVAASWLFNDDAYFALVERYFSNQAGRLRDDVDDTYASYFSERILRMEAFGSDVATEDLIRRSKELEDFTRKKLTRRGLDVLCRKRRIEDAERVRRNLESGYTEPSKYDAEFLEQQGQWSDITALTAGFGPRSGSLGLAVMEGCWDAVARAAIKIGRNAVSELMSLKMPSEVMKKVIELCPESRFSKISDDALFGLLDDGSDEVRKAAAIRAVRSFPAKRVRSILDEYISRDDHRYYNVIHWLDLGVSMPRRDARKVAGAATS